MTKQDIQEDLVRLYLRLNGYFTTGLIIHSSTLGKNQTELDAVAVRFPYHNQTDRVVGCSDFLQIPEDTIDIIIAEVKSGGEQIQFNTALRSDRTSLEKLVGWIGAFDQTEIAKIVDDTQIVMTPEQINKPDKFKTLLVKGKSGNFSIRPIVFSLDRPEPKKNQTRYIYGQLMLDFIWECFRPSAVRQSCSTVYNLNMWGHSTLPVIQYFKDDIKTSVGNIQDYYRHFGFS